jgi:hypothetical protein
MIYLLQLSIVIAFATEAYRIICRILTQYAISDRFVLVSLHTKWRIQCRIRISMASLTLSKQIV